MLFSWMVINFADHRGEKRRLRTGEEVGAVGVEDCAVVFDLVKKVLDHSFGKLRIHFVLFFDETENDEVAVPAIHFVESASRYDVAIGEVEEALYRDFSNANVAHVEDFARQVPHLDVALSMRGGNGRWGGHSVRKIEHRCCRNFGIEERFAVSHGTGKGVPAVINVGEYLFVRFSVVATGLSKHVGCERTDRDEEDDVDADCLF